MFGYLNISFTTFITQWPFFLSLYFFRLHVLSCWKVLPRSKQRAAWREPYFTTTRSSLIRPTLSIRQKRKIFNRTAVDVFRSLSLSLSFFYKQNKNSYKSIIHLSFKQQIEQSNCVEAQFSVSGVKMSLSLLLLSWLLFQRHSLSAHA